MARGVKFHPERFFMVKALINITVASSLRADFTIAEEDGKGNLSSSAKVKYVHRLSCHHFENKKVDHFQLIKN